MNPQGTLCMRAGGFGFVQTAEGEYFIPEGALAGAFDGDLVELAPLRSSSRAKRSSRRCPDAFSADVTDKPAARVLRVLDRAHDCVVGRYEVAEPFGVVVPEDPRIPYDIFTMRSENPDIADGSVVVVRICQFPTRNSAATGVIEQVIGRAGEASSGVDLIVARHKLETEFSDASLEEARDAKLDEPNALVSGYRDISSRFVFTVDPADARDFDDALSCEIVSSDQLERDLASAGKGAFRNTALVPAHMTRLGVHIADVSHYVPWNSSLDLEARRRATSVYLVDRVIPMLPHELSCDLCSLRPNETRRAMTVDLYLDDEASLIAFCVYPSLIRSRARLSYDEALTLLDSPEEGLSSVDASLSNALVSRLSACSKIALRRADARLKKGGIDFDTVEARVKLDEESSPVQIDLRRKNRATSLIEEAMILANEAIAQFLEHREWPCAYRVHEAPSNENLSELAVAFLDFPWCTDELAGRISLADPCALQAAIELSRGRSEGEMISSLLLRAMKRASYRPDNAGHYGLSSDAYCHFTSPIRRYPDLVVHRMVKAALFKRPEKFDQEVNALPWICEHSSSMERVAEAAARESQVLKILEYLERYVGVAFSGVVSGVAQFGLFVKLDCTAEGLLPLRALGREYFEHDVDHMALVGQQTGRVYRFGQRIAVRIKHVDPQAGKLEFVLAGQQ